MEENKDKPKSLAGQIVLNYGSIVKVYLVSGEVLVSDHYLTNDRGVYAIGKWQEDTLRNYTEPAQGLKPFPDGINKMCFIPFEQVKALVFDIDGKDLLRPSKAEPKGNFVQG